MSKKIVFLLMSLFLLVSLQAQDRKKTGEGYSEEKTISIKSKKIKKRSYVAWLYPIGDNLNLTGDSIEIKAQIGIFEDMKSADVELWRNGEKMSDKADEVSLFGDDTDEEYSYTNNIYLDPGLNEFQILLIRALDTVRSEKLIINKNSNNEVLSAALQGNENNSAPLAIFWKSPDVLKLGGRTLPIEDGNFMIEFVIMSKVPVKKEDIRVTLNGVINKDYSLQRLRHLGNNQYSFRMPLTLIKEGTNTVEAFLKTSLGSVKSKTLTLDFNAIKPRLHILAIGPDRPDLDYTSKDADDFAGIFIGMDRNGIQLFSGVEVDVLKGFDATTQNIREKIGELHTRFNVRKSIQPRDLVVVFISSHGFLWEGKELRIQGADYKSENAWATSISYQKDILDVLDGISCKKLIFIDACHSGSGGSKDATSDLNYFLKELNEARDGMTTIASSREDEKSYEDASWENGAFTKAIKMGLQNGEADKDGNKVITVAELYQYLNLKVPQLVYAAKSEVQNPMMINDILKNITIYSTQ